MNHRRPPKIGLLGATLTVLPGLSAAAAVGGGSGSVAPDAYRADVAAWRQTRDARLRAEDGWLTLVGLTWLKPGSNRFGSASDDDVHLPPAVPAHAGTLEPCGWWSPTAHR